MNSKSTDKGSTFLKWFSIIQQAINILSIWSILLPVFTGLFAVKKLRKEGVLILLLVTAATVPQVLRGVLGKHPVIYLFYNINVLAELIIMYVFFTSNLYWKFSKRIMRLSLGASLIAGIMLVIDYGTFFRFLNEWVCLNNLFYTGWILLLLLEIYERDDFELNRAVPLFWFVIGLFLYCSCTVLIFSLWNYIRANERSLLNNLWIIHDVFNITMYIVFSYGLFLYYKLKPAV